MLRYFEVGAPRLPAAAAVALGRLGRLSSLRCLLGFFLQLEDGRSAEIAHKEMRAHRHTTGEGGGADESNGRLLG